jgi:hypothetical protein
MDKNISGGTNYKFSCFFLDGLFERELNMTVKNKPKLKRFRL